MYPVKLYVYDLSRGMARQMSQQFMGRQIDGIWHTSVVVFGKEFFYGQGILITAPGQSQHGTPMQVVDMGTTGIDEETFRDYISQLRTHYTAEKYHLLDFNCNSFTNDVVGFLTGASIPPWIRDLPADFLSTPLGAMLRPRIDAMFGGPRVPPADAPPLAAESHLNSVASNATEPAQTLTSHLHVASNLASFNSILSGHKGTVAFFTSKTCGPCQMIEPVFEELAQTKARQGGIAFVKIDLGVGLGREVAREWKVTATPTFIFFRGSTDEAELRGADAPELRTQTDLLIFGLFPPHPHTKLNLPSIRGIGLKPILYSKPPPFGKALEKIATSINNSASSGDASFEIMSKEVVPALEKRFPATPSSTPSPPITSDLLNRWHHATSDLLQRLPESSIFPLIDFWRIAVLDSQISAWCASKQPDNPISTILDKISGLLDSSSPLSRNVVLTALRLFSNCFAHQILAQKSSSIDRPKLTTVLVATLLHSDTEVRTAAASLAFNLSAFIQKPLVEAAREGRSGEAEEDATGEAEWTIEFLSALVEAIQREQNEDALHRLTASLAFLVHLSPWYSAQLELLRVLEVKEILRIKIGQGESEEKPEVKVVKVVKPEVKRLVKEVSEKLCPEDLQ